MKNKNILYISHSYNAFIKEPIEKVSNQFDIVYVLVRHNPISEISNFLPINYLKIYSKKNLIDFANKPQNIEIIPTSILYIPIDSQYKKLGEEHFKKVDATIQKRKLDFDLIHSHFVWSAGYAGAKLKEKYDLPLIVTAHGYDIYDLPFRDNEWKEKIVYVLDSSDYIITVSRRNENCIRKLGIKKPVEVIPNGFDGSFFKYMDLNNSRKELNLPINKKIILNVGNLYDEIKGHEYLIEAINKITTYRTDILCIIIGSGKLKNRLHKQIKNSGLEKYIILIGGKPHNEIPLWINACDVFVLPSLDEGNPTVMFECLGCGKPFIGTNVGGIPEIITSDDYGFVVEPKNPHELAEKILVALEKDWDHEKIKNYATQFEWKNLTGEILKIYNSVLNENE